MDTSLLRLETVPLAGKRVFIRADFNVPLTPDGRVSDDTRIRATLPGIRRCLDAGAAVMVASHLGRPVEGALTPDDSLAPVAECLAGLLGRPVAIVTDWVDGGFTVAPGELVMLENCRGNRGEKADDPQLAARIARWIDVYVNEAFGTAHRKECTLRAVERKLAARRARLWLPEDVVTADRFSADARVAVRSADEVRAGEMVLDIGPRAQESLAAELAHAGTIVWNGPLGVFELAPFAAGTRALAEAIGASAAFSIAGGGDTLAAIAAFGVGERIDYISTGGGAFLEFLEGRDLPAVAALHARARPASRRVEPSRTFEHEPELTR